MGVATCTTRHAHVSQEYILFKKKTVHHHLYRYRNKFLKLS